ncbi:MAG TPA: BrnT family toxin [Candidatus Angelobacter sp.]|jgi:hypothetical protein|nr:BrnT family toxin [Candidatus Angelobacter sp.]
MMMRFIWDAEKNLQNLAKHGVSFELATVVFEDPLAVSVPDPFEDEERWQTIGVIKGVLILLVIHTAGQRGDDEEVRIISARKATRHERRKYEETQYEN